MADSRVSTTQVHRQNRVSRFFGQYLIKFRFQFKFAMVIFFFLSISMGVIWLEGHLAVNHMIETGMVESEQAADQLKLLTSIVGKTSLLALSLVFGLSLFFSHFVAGPIYRFEKTLEQMKTGDLTGFVRLRKNDELKDTAEVFNHTIASLRRRIVKERETVHSSIEKLRAVSEKLRQAGHTEQATELDHLLVELTNTPPQIKV